LIDRLNARIGKTGEPDFLGADSGNRNLTDYVLRGIDQVHLRVDNPVIQIGDRCRNSFDRIFGLTQDPGDPTNK
jgi:hypothetical protein